MLDFLVLLVADRLAKNATSSSPTKSLLYF